MAVHPLGPHSTPPPTLRILAAPAQRRVSLKQRVDAAVNRLLDITLWCERAERLDAEARAADAIHDLHLHLALRKLRLAAEMAGDPETKRMLGEAAGNILVAQEHDAREDAFAGAIATIVARIAKRVRGLCLSLDTPPRPCGRPAGRGVRSR
jgi:hypothetical protein